MRFVKALGIFMLLIAAAIAVMLIMGSMLPVAHTASASADIAAPQADVWRLLEDVQGQRKWRTGLKSVEPMADQNGHRCWSEVQQHMRMPLCEDLTVEPSTRIVRIADPKLAFGGSWTYQLQPIDANSTRLIVTENGTTGPALWRFLGHYVFHEDTMIKQYEADVQRVASK